MVEEAKLSSERSLNELEAFEVGLWGEKKGRDWCYKPDGAITGVMITCDSYCVISFDFKGIDEKGNTEYSDSIGCHCENVYHVMLDWPQEYFTSISGTYYEGKENYYISSLSLTTNLKKYGPYGHPEKSIPFDFPMKGKVIVGFYGQVVKENWVYGGIGVYVKDSSSQQEVVKPKTKIIGSNFKKEECIKAGPWGWSRSTKEKEWSYMFKGETDIKIHYNDESIKGISFKSTSDGNVVKHSQKSNPSNENSKVISLKWPEEYLISIRGTLRYNVKDIESLCFYTNRRIYGPYGPVNGYNPFRFYMKEGIIVGFHGHFGDYFDGLGVYIKPYSELFSSLIQGQIENANVNAGPFGGQEGKEWNYKPNGAITEITISHGWVINSLSFRSVDQIGKCEDSDKFGGEGGDTTLIAIDWPREYLTSISGTHHTFIKKQQVIESLYFHTNKKKYGPFGRTDGSPFDLPLKDRIIVGFYGRSSDYINAIGVYQKGHSSEATIQGKK